jgi:ABC-2 type transport system ATP-binding protein
LIQSTEAPWAVEFAGFAKCYRPTWTGRRLAAVESLTLRLAPGQVLGLLGPNGSGKSTILKALAGLIVPTRGTCRIFGHEAGSDAARALVGYLPESPQFSPHLTGREFLEYCAGLSALAPAEAARRVAEMLQWSGLVLMGQGRLLAQGTPAELLGAGCPAVPAPSRLEQLYLEKLRENG